MKNITKKYRKKNKTKYNKKKKTIKKIMKKYNKKKITGAGKVYKSDGTFEDISDKHDGNEIFRKMTRNIREFKICEILKENPHENIVTIYKINDFGINDNGKQVDNCYIDMEVLDTNLERFSLDEIRTTMKGVKDFLQKLGIVYIDWKPDNIGIDNKGKLKLFDFDVSGLIDTKTGEWRNWEVGWKRKNLKTGNEEEVIMNGDPAHFFAYNQAVLAGKTTPIDIDDYAFKKGLSPTKIDDDKK